MEEDRKNGNLPYPVMDIDFLHTEQHSGSVHHYYSTIGTNIHFLVRYKCCSCGAENEDDDQFFRFETKTHAYHPHTLTDNDAQIVKGIKDRQGRNKAAEMEANIRARRYQSLGLKCSCARCGKKQPWSDFWPEGGFFEAIVSLHKSGNDLAFFAAIATVIVFILLIKYPLALAGFVFLLLLPSIAALVHNGLTQARSLKLDKEYRPEISIVYRPGSSPTE